MPLGVAGRGCTRESGVRVPTPAEQLDALRLLIRVEERFEVATYSPVRSCISTEGRGAFSAAASPRVTVALPNA